MTAKPTNERESLEKEYKLLLFALNQSSEGIAMVDMDGNLKYLNNAFAEMHGYSVPELVGKNLSIFHTPEQMSHVEAANLEVKQTGSFKGEVWHVRRDGTVFPTIMHNSLIRDKKNKPIGMMGALRDITENKQIEQMMRESKERLDLAIQGTTMGIWDWDIQTGNLAYSKHWATIMEYEYDELIPHMSTFESLIHPEDRERVVEALLKHFKDDAEYNLEFRLKTKSGNWKWINSRGKVIIRDKDNRALRMLGIHMDINERRKAEDAFKEQAKTLHDILENAGDGICLCHNVPEWPHVRFTHWNPRMTEITGYTMDEINRLGWYQTMYPDPEVQRQAIERMAKMRRGDDILSEVWVITTKGGEQKATSISTTILKEENGKTHVLALMKDISEQKHYEEELITSRKEWEEIFHAIGHPTIIMDPKHGIIEANKAALTITGLNKYQIQNRKCFEIFHSTNEPPKNCPMESLAQKGNIETVEMEMEALGRTYLVSCTPVTDNDGNLIKIIHIATDITDRKQAEESLRESEERLEFVLKGSQLGFWDWNIEKNEVRRNERWAEMLGYKLDEIEFTVKQWLDFIHPDDRSIANQSIQDHLEGRTPMHKIEYRMLTKDGQHKWILDQAQVVKHGSHGRPIRMSGTHTDITERKQAEKALRKSEELFRSVYQTAPLAFVVWDKNTHVTDWNEKAEEVFGWSKEEVVGTCFFDFLIPEKDRPHVEDVVDSLLKGKLSSHTINNNLTKEGKTITCEWNNSVLHDDDGNVIGAISLALDITERKQAEEESRKALEFAAEQSKHALIGQVAGKMAHDFNNVLMGIMGNAQLALLDCHDEKIKRKLERINEFSERGRDITGNLLSFAKDQEPKQTYFKIEDKIDLAIKMFEKELTGIQVSRNYKSGIPELLADPGMIQDVLANLIQNSIHAVSKVENPTIKLKAYSQDDKVYVEVEDNGCGIPREHQDSIYTPSFTLKGSHDRTGSYRSEIKGTGYGMSNVKKYIVEKHKGDIFLESEVGKGTKITIVLRVIKPQLSDDEKREVVKSQIYDTRRILLVEDEPAIADIQYQILTDEPFRHIVSIAVNGKTAIDIFDRNRFDVISLDYMLPGNIHGMDVYNHIREKDKDVPVLFISGNIEFLESIKKLKEKDPNLEHLSKPVNNLDYVNKINELIGKHI